MARIAHLSARLWLNFIGQLVLVFGASLVCVCVCVAVTEEANDYTLFRGKVLEDFGGSLCVSQDPRACAFVPLALPQHPLSSTACAIQRYQATSYCSEGRGGNHTHNGAYLSLSVPRVPSTLQPLVRTRTHRTCLTCTLPHSSITPHAKIFGRLEGGIPPGDPSNATPTASIARTTSMPLLTLPKATCFRSKFGAGPSS
jgi:hypothetical protein